MLSRVAAVKAPRTHNRRGVTGSSGMRREGRESEPQRPNMSRHLFYSAVPLFLLLVMMCCNAGGAAVAPEQSSDPQFEWKDANEGGVTVESLGAPGLLKVGSDVFAVAEAQCKKSDVSFTGIASQLLTIEADKEKEEVLNEVKDTQFLEEATSADSKKKVDVSRPTTVMKGNDIYMLAGKYSRTAAGKEDGAEKWGLLLVRGQFNADEGGGQKRIKWRDNDGVSRIPVGERQSWSRLTGGGGSAIETEDGRLMFPVEGTKKGEAPKDEKTVSLLIYTSDNAASWKLSKGTSDGGCSDPSVVEWRTKNS
ncbi:trans-sialidase [Trypanosoma cruzi]|nr:trans-sialidase [Trypanosoma cruzi]